MLMDGRAGLVIMEMRKISWHSHESNPEFSVFQNVA
jgi:hypothetical protein